MRNLSKMFNFYEEIENGGISIKTPFFYYLKVIAVLLFLHIGILPLITKLIGFEEAALAYRNGKFYTPPLVIQHLLYSITYYHTLLIVVFYYFDREFIKVNLFKHRAVIYKGSVFGQSRREVFFDFAEIKEIAGGTAFIFYCGYEKIKVSMSTSNFGSKRLVEYAAKNDINYT